MNLSEEVLKLLKDSERKQAGYESDRDDEEDSQS